MEETNGTKVIPLDYIRGLIVAQEGRCAITGMILDPIEVNADHVVPLSRSDLKPSMGRENIWLVHKQVNAMKGTMTYDELVELARRILAHETKSRELLSKLQTQQVSSMSKPQFDQWVSIHCDESGRITK